MLEISNFQRVGAEDAVAANRVKKSTKDAAGLAAGLAADLAAAVDADVDN